ncbi:thioredoxin-disulfide reductase [Dyadobacter frigoris]|uniref:Thioredoxin reductase n=1 Tax=Dyadobacter frigoris TaxID=2576211 RepID=A0A4V6BJ29_9BACT|nr:thioredoxin-disulfide reductase [Dyadobacter frigoris]TKT92483.1 thioredoxin-disulfide reductase [Dyadobacter frigoris]GLU55273.1 thioredoxin-disulfide reductase [Dyadobacter frigoris]
MEHVQCLIIGAGPAGYTAAIYAARANLKPVMYVGNQPGGQLTITNDVENYPGFPDGIMGPEMMELFDRQAKRFDADIRYGEVTHVDFSIHPHQIKVDGKKSVTANTVIIATGASAKWLGLPSETRLNGSGVSACAVCDGFFYRGQDVAIVGAGDTACEEAMYLSKLCNHVHMLIRKNHMRASKIMESRIRNTPNITIHWNTDTEEILGESTVTGALVKDTQTGQLREIQLQGFFVAIGHHPNASVFSKYLETDAQGYIITQPDSTKTNIHGVFACGDVQDKHFRQAVTAAGSGCMAALEAERFLIAYENHMITAAD